MSCNKNVILYNIQYINFVKRPNLRTHFIFCHGMFMPIYRKCPGSGSGFVSLHTDPDPDPTFIILIWIHGSGSASLNLNITITYMLRNFCQRDTLHNFRGPKGRLWWRAASTTVSPARRPMRACERNIWPMGAHLTSGPSRSASHWAASRPSIRATAAAVAIRKQIRIHLGKQTGITHCPS